MKFTASLRGEDEVPLIITSGTGGFDAEMKEQASEIKYWLWWDRLESAARAAHVHLGKEGTNGGVIVTLGEGKEADLDGQKGSLQGIITAASVERVSFTFAGQPRFQGIGAGEFHKLVAALKAGHCYVNIHTVDHSGPVGEVRGQIRKG